jgi:Flp pilus assembly protein TadD
MQEHQAELEMYRAAYEANREDRDAGTNLAQHYADLGWYNEAVGIYRDLVDRFPEDYALLLDYGNLLHHRQNSGEALAVFGKLTLLKPERLEGWNNLGIVQLTSGKYDEARTSFEKVLELEPGNCGALLNMGNYFDRMGGSDKAIEMFERATQVRSDFADAWFNLGNAYVKAQRFADAVDAYQHSLRVQREFPSALKNLGYAYEQLGDFEQATEQYGQALELNKADAGLYINLANVYLKQEKFDTAKSYYLRAVKLAPKDPAGWLGLRRLSLMKGDIALYVHATLALLHRLEPDAIAESLRTLREIGKLDSVDQIIKAADRLDKCSDELDAERLLAYQRTGHNAARARTLQQRLGGDRPASDTVRYCLAAFMEKNGETAAALAQLASVKDPRQCHLVLRWRLMIADAQAGVAETEIRTYLAGHEDCFEGWLLLARIMAGQSREQPAREYLLKALETGFIDTGRLDFEPLLRRIYDELTAAGERPQPPAPDAAPM